MGESRACCRQLNLDPKLFYTLTVQDHADGGQDGLSYIHHCMTRKGSANHGNSGSPLLSDSDDIKAMKVLEKIHERHMKSKESLIGTLRQEDRFAADEHRGKMRRKMRSAQAQSEMGHVSCFEEHDLLVTSKGPTDDLFDDTSNEDGDSWQSFSVASSGTSAPSNARTSRDDLVKLPNDMPVGKSNLNDGYRYKRPCRRNSSEDRKGQFTDAYGFPAEYADLPILEKNKIEQKRVWHANSLCLPNRTRLPYKPRTCVSQERWSERQSQYRLYCGELSSRTSSTQLASYEHRDSLTPASYRRLRHIDFSAQLRLLSRRSRFTIVVNDLGNTLNTFQPNYEAKFWSDVELEIVDDAEILGKSRQIREELNPSVVLLYDSCEYHKGEDQIILRTDQQKTTYLEHILDHIQAKMWKSARLLVVATNSSILLEHLHRLPNNVVLITGLNVDVNNLPPTLMSDRLSVEMIFQSFRAPWMTAPSIAILFKALPEPSRRLIVDELGEWDAALKRYRPYAHHLALQVLSRIHPYSRGRIIRNVRNPLLRGVLPQTDKSLSKIYGFVLALATFRPEVLREFEHRPPTSPLRPFLQIQHDQTLVLDFHDIPQWVQNAVDAIVAHTAATRVDLSCRIPRTPNRSGQKTSLLAIIEQQWSFFLHFLNFDTVPTVVIAAHSEKTECGYTLNSLLERLDPKDLLQVFQEGQAWVNLVLFTEYGNEIVSSHGSDMPKSATLVSTTPQEEKLWRECFVPDMNFCELCFAIALGIDQGSLALAVSAGDFYQQEVITYNPQSELVWDVHSPAHRKINQIMQRLGRDVFNEKSSGPHRIAFKLSQKLECALSEVGCESQGVIGY